MNFPTHDLGCASSELPWASTQELAEPGAAPGEGEGGQSPWGWASGVSE